MAGDEDAVQIAKDDDVLLMLDTVRAELIEELKQLRQAGQSDAITKATVEIKELTTTIQTTSDTLLRRLDEPVMPELRGHLAEILGVLRAEKEPPAIPRNRLVGAGLGLILLTASLTWYLAHTPAVVKHRAALMEYVHGVLVEGYGTIPPALKAQLTSVYKQRGFALEPPKGGKP